MNSLHQAVTRAIAETRLAAENDWRRVALDKELAAAAIGVCLAEAQRAVAAIEPVVLYGGRALPKDEVMAVLAALAEEQARAS